MSSLSANESDSAESSTSSSSGLVATGESSERESSPPLLEVLHASRDFHTSGLDVELVADVSVGDGISFSPFMLNMLASCERRGSTSASSGDAETSSATFVDVLKTTS